MVTRMAWHHGGWRGERRRRGFVTVAAEMGREARTKMGYQRYDLGFRLWSTAAWLGLGMVNGGGLTVVVGG
ncbi:hypothetical protein V6N11_001316 [Hibiscus sabdariffa]|uniref:Uncharacterized protein n=1 Tax=Hibiscus sabdariffa TaxID=183260 RepID=A0ABR2RZD5_9ROSI